jgi:heme-degrading monooxygenase HmoA
MTDKPVPPYYAVIITSKLKSMTEEVRSRYLTMSDAMYELAQKQDGFLGMDYARDEALGITVSYWRSLDAIEKWRRHADHVAVKAVGRKDFYASYDIRICRVEREYGGP